jgi:hypothetical protein
MVREITYHFQYTSSEIYSAHRLRFLHGNQIKVVGLVAQQLYPEDLHRPAGSTWGTPIGMAIILGGLCLTILLIAPVVDYRFNADWKRAYALFLSKEAFRIEDTSGKMPGTPIKWNYVNRVLENATVIVMLLGSDRVFVVIPKRLFENQEQEAFFRKILTKRTSIKTIKDAG